MGQAGIADGRHDLDRDSAPRARHQGGGDGARGAVEARQNAFRDALAQPFQGETEGGGPFDARTLLDGGGAEREADGAELAEKGLALEVEGAGRGGRRRRREDGAQADPVAGGETGLVAGQAQARPFRRLDRGKGRDAQAIEGDAAGPGQDLDGDDPANDADRAKAMVENRRRDEDRPPLDGGEAEGEDAERQGRYQGHRAPAAQPAKPAGGGDPGQAEPSRRLRRQGEIKPDAEPQQDRKPEHPTFPFVPEDGSQPVHRSATPGGTQNPAKRRFSFSHSGHRGRLFLQVLTNHAKQCRAHHPRGAAPQP